MHRLAWISSDLIKKNPNPAIRSPLIIKFWHIQQSLVKSYATILKHFGLVNTQIQLILFGKFLTSKLTYMNWFIISILIFLDNFLILSFKKTGVI